MQEGDLEGFNELEMNFDELDIESELGERITDFIERSSSLNKRKSVKPSSILFAH